MNLGYSRTMTYKQNGKLFLALMVLLLVPVKEIIAKEKLLYPGPYKADVYYITDGDTFFARAHLWPGLNADVNIRLLGVDTPETRRPKCDSEKVAGKAATAYLMELLGSTYRGAVLGKPLATVELRNVKRGKYAGRILADVFYNGQNVTEAILKAGHGRVYDGGKREGWCG